MIRVVMALVSTAVGLVLLLSFKSQSTGAPRSALGAGTTSGVGATSGAGTTSGADTTSGAGGTPTSGPTLGPTSSTAKAKAKPKPVGKSGTFTGTTIDTQYGPIQVAAVLTNGKLTNVQVLQETYGGRSQEIDAAAFPVLKSEALSKGSANIDVVSGATFTSQGYAQSLQSALDQAKA